MSNAVILGAKVYPPIEVVLSPLSHQTSYSHHCLLKAAVLPDMLFAIDEPVHFCYIDGLATVGVCLQAKLP